MGLASPNSMVWTYFRSLERIAARVPQIGDPIEQRDEIALAFFLAVAAVEAFVNVFFRVLVDEPGGDYISKKGLVLTDLDESEPGGPKGLKYKLNNWPPKILGKSLAWQTGIARDFEELRLRRNALMHFTSAHETVQIPGNVYIYGLVNTAAYDELNALDAAKAHSVATGMVEELLRLTGIPEEHIPHGLHQWTGKVPI
jgi:hypothetical protein